MKRLCRCYKCGHGINTRKRKNVEYEIVERGYKYEYENYYLKCPHCNCRQQISFSKVPFRIKWRIFIERFFFDYC